MNQKLRRLKTQVSTAYISATTSVNRTKRAHLSETGAIGDVADRQPVELTNWLTDRRLTGMKRNFWDCAGLIILLLSKPTKPTKPTVFFALNTTGNFYMVDQIDKVVRGAHIVVGANKCGT